MKKCSFCDNDNPDHLSKCMFCNKPFPNTSGNSITGSAKSSGTVSPVSPPSIPKKISHIPTSVITPPPISPVLPPAKSFKPYIYTLPRYFSRLGSPNIQGEIRDVSEHLVNEKKSLPLILGGLMMLKDFFSGLTMMYWGRNKEVHVTHLLVEDEITGEKREAKLVQRQGGYPRIGNHVSLFGKLKSGVLHVRRGYNHDTRSEFVGK